MKEYKNKRKFTIILGKCYPAPDEEDWPTETNTSCRYEVYGLVNLTGLMNRIINACPTPWWWIFEGEVEEDNLILSGAIDPGDLDIIEELNN
jgi:hypothetical protein